MDSREAFYIKKYNSTSIKIGYNILSSSIENPMHTEHAKEKMRENWKDPIYREKQSNSRKGIERDASWRNNHSRAAFNFWEDEDHRKLISSKAKKRWEENGLEMREKMQNGLNEFYKNRSKEKLNKIIEIANKHLTLTSIAKELNTTIHNISEFLKRMGARELVKSMLKKE